MLQALSLLGQPGDAYCLYGKEKSRLFEVSPGEFSEKPWISLGGIMYLGLLWITGTEVTESGSRPPAAVHVALLKTAL